MRRDCWEVIRELVMVVTIESGCQVVIGIPPGAWAGDLLLTNPERQLALRVSKLLGWVTDHLPLASPTCFEQSSSRSARSGCRRCESSFRVERYPQRP